MVRKSVRDVPETEGVLPRNREREPKGRVVGMVVGVGLGVSDGRVE